MEIPWSRPDISEEDVRCVSVAVGTTWVSGGEYIEKFSSELGEFLKTSNVALVSNGTAALSAVFLHIGLEPDDEVIVPAYGFMAAANVLLQMRALPVFVDVEGDSWCLDLNDLRKKLSERTRAVVVTHTYGNTSQLKQICELVRRESSAVIIEDAAEALGSQLEGSFLGTIGDFGTFSFHATKVVTTGEGGAITWRDDSHSERLRLLISHGLDRKSHYLHQLPGNNFRLSNICAALGYSQLQRLAIFIEKRLEIDALYRSHLSTIEGQHIEFQKLASSSIVPWSFPIRIAPAIDRDSVLRQLSSNGIETRPGFVAPNRLSYFQSTEGSHPVSETLSKSILSLPAFPSLSGEEVKVISEVVKKILLNS
jgi:perosamine synthetase